MKRRWIPWGRMYPVQKMLGYAALLTTSLMISCEKKDPEPDCGCDSEQIGFLTETNAHYRGSGLFMVYDTNQFQRLGLFTVCEYAPSWKISEKEVYDYKISGYYMKQCLYPDIIPLVTNNPLKVSSIVLPQ